MDYKERLCKILTSNDTQSESQTTSVSNWHLLGVVPTLQIVVCVVALAKPVVLNKDDDKEGSREVSEQREEVLKISQKLILARKSEKNDGDEAQQCPDESRNDGQRPGELLETHSQHVAHTCHSLLVRT